MSINVDDAFEVNENGIVLSNDAGTRGLYITSGSGAPTLDAPVNSWYFREDTNVLYYKWGANATDWRMYGEQLFARQNPDFTTTNTAFETALSINAGTVPAGTYCAHWSYRSRNSKSNTNNETQVAFNGLALVTNTVIGNTTSVQTPLGGGLGEQFSGFAEFTVLSVPLTLTLDIRRTAGNGAARVNTMNLKLCRVS